MLVARKDMIGKYDDIQSTFRSTYPHRRHLEEGKTESRARDKCQVKF
jgi:hypothetical protein